MNYQLNYNALYYTSIELHWITLNHIESHCTSIELHWTLHTTNVFVKHPCLIRPKSCINRHCAIPFVSQCWFMENHLVIRYSSPTMSKKNTSNVFPATHICTFMGSDGCFSQSSSTLFRCIFRTSNGMTKVLCATSPFFKAVSHTSFVCRAIIWVGDKPNA